MSKTKQRLLKAVTWWKINQQILKKNLAEQLLKKNLVQGRNQLTFSVGENLLQPLFYLTNKKIWRFQYPFWNFAWMAIAQSHPGWGPGIIDTHLHVGRKKEIKLTIQSTSAIHQKNANWGKISSQTLWYIKHGMENLYVL